MAKKRGTNTEAEPVTPVLDETLTEEIEADANTDTVIDMTPSDIHVALQDIDYALHAIGQLHVDSSTQEGLATRLLRDLTLQLGTSLRHAIARLS